MYPFDTFFPPYRNTFFSHGGAHGEVSAAQVDQVDFARGNLQGSRQSMSQLFTEGQYVFKSQIMTPLHRNVPVTVRPC